MRLQCAVPTGMSEEFTVQLSTLYFTHDVIRQHCAYSWPRSWQHAKFKPIFQVKGNIFRLIFFGYFIDDWLLYNSAAESFHTTKLCSRLYSTEIEFYSKNWKIGFWATLWGLGRFMHSTYSSFESQWSISYSSWLNLFAISYSSDVKAEICWSQHFLKWWVTLKLNFRLKGYFSRQYLWTVRQGNGRTTTLQLEFFTQRNFAADYATKVDFYFFNQKNHFLSHPLGDLG